MSLPATHENTTMQALNLCLYRLHGRRVAPSGVRIPREGLVLGSDNLFAAGLTTHYSTLHVVPNHAVVRSSATGWELAPGCQDMVVALNDERIPWGDSRPLRPGDKIDMGFASLQVEDALQESECCEQTPEPGILEIADIQVVADFPELSETTKNEEDADVAAPPVPSVDAHDPLAALAAESSRVLAEKMRMPDSCLPSGPSLSPMPGTLPVETPPPAGADGDPLADLPTAASLEEILEGPLSIDDVLDSLQRAHPSAVPAFGDPLAAMAVPDAAPDPLLLLAGVDVLPVREPELAPVLHREHRVTGINSPYRFTVDTDHDDHNEEDSWPQPIR